MTTDNKLLDDMFLYFDTPYDDRIPYRQQLRKWDISPMKYGIIKSAWKEERGIEEFHILPIDREKEERAKEKKVKDKKLANIIGNGIVTPESFLQENKMVAFGYLLESCRKGNATAQRTFFQLSGDLVEKSEQKVTLELSADEIARRNLTAERQLNEGGHGMEEVSGQSPLLPEDICQD